MRGQLIFSLVQKSTYNYTRTFKELWREKKLGRKLSSIFLIIIVKKNCFGTYSLHSQLFSADY